MATGFTYRINMKFALSESRAKFTWVMPSNGNLGEANGRCYDPMMSSFLSVDACLQDPTSAQGFNRYAYCAYNPLRYTDPTGWEMGSGNGNLPDDYPPIPDGTYVLPEVPIIADGVNSSSGGYNPQGTPGTPGNYPYTPTIPSVPDGHSGTPASQNGPYYQPAPNPGNGSSGGHGTGGNIGGNNSSHGNSVVSYGLSVSGTIASYNATYYETASVKELKDLGEKARPILKKLNNPLAKESTRAIGNEIKNVLPKASNAIGCAGLSLEVMDMVENKQVKPSNVLNVAVGITCLIASGPAGWIIGGVYLVGDLVSYAYTGRSIGGNLDYLYYKH